MLDLFCGRFGWGRAFAARGWEVVGVDLVEPAEILANCCFAKGDVLTLRWTKVQGFAGPNCVLGKFDFVCASSPCEEFAVHGMKHFHPNPLFPDMGAVLFCYTRRLLETSGTPFVMENVRAAQYFVGNAGNHCGSFHLWGTAVPPIVPQGIKKGASQKRRDGRYGSAKLPVDELMYMDRRERAASLAVIPPELANCVADYAERLIEQRRCA